MTDSEAGPERAARLRDARDLRAVAHPTRLRLLGLLRTNGPATGAMLAAGVGEAAGTVSYHLRTLAAAGLIEHTEPRSTDRRATWWTASHDVTAWDSTELAGDPETATAANTLDHLVGQVYARSWSDYVDAAPRLEPEWTDAAVSGDRALHLTADDLAELGRELDALTARWLKTSAARRDDVDARTVMLVVQAYRRVG